MAYYRVRRTGEQIQNGTELYHHGILGQKWGVRRFQNKDGTLTAAGRRRAAKEYDYTTSDAYKNASRGGKQAMTNTYDWNRRRYGKKAANRIEYKVNEEGEARYVAQRREYGKAVLKGILAYAAIRTTMYAISIASSRASTMYETGKVYMDINNKAITAYAQEHGLNVEHRRGFTPGFSAVSRVANAANKNRG